MPPSTTKPETVFKALADATRHRVLALLSRHELSVTELVEILRQPQSTVSRHLRVLRDAGLILDRRDGNTVLYSVASYRSDVDAPGGVNGSLTGRALAWVAEEPLIPPMAARLEEVMGRRREMSHRFFHRVGHHWDALREESFGTHFHLEAFLALLPPEWVVADIGTGTGYLLPTLARHFDRVIGVEPVERMLEAARRRTEYYGLNNVSLECGDLGQLPINETAVDLAIALLVLHHVPTPDEALKELFRVLRHDGCVLIVEQTAHQSESFRERMQDRWWGFEPPRLCSLLESVGFSRVRSRPLLHVDRAADAPELFVVTGRKTSKKEQPQ
ncbi:MAG: metalloregulator ArsR/SmtB family transcription factor [Planctomycetes bacterium]|nr:metalloregulator ArsR/SmtB family transcription factor [Planctomycetota bacterium]